MMFRSLQSTQGAQSKGQGGQSTGQGGHSTSGGRKESLKKKGVTADPVVKRHLKPEYRYFVTIYRLLTPECKYFVAKYRVISFV